MSEHRPPEGGYKSNKPKLTKAERRALQEQQRAAKAAAGGKGAGGAAAGGGKPPKPSPSGGEGKANPKGAGNSNSANSANSISSSNANNNANSNSTSNSNSNSTTSSDNNSDNKENQKSLFSHLAAPVEIDPTSLTLSLAGTGGESLFNSPFSTSTSTSTSTSSSTSRSSTSSSSALHPSIIELGYAYASGKTKGSTRRCREMLLAFMQVVQDFEPSEGTSDTSGSSAMGGKGQGSNGSNGRGGGSGGGGGQNQNQNQNQNQKTHKTGRGRMKGGVYKELSTSLKNAFSYLTSLRPHSISMGNAFKSLKKSVNTIPVDLPFDGQGGGRERILEEIDRFINERITLPQGVIADIAITKINRGDVVLTYGDSEVIRKVLKAGYERDLQRNKNGEVGFRVVVVDSRPLMEGKSMVKYLSLECPEMEVAYVLLSGLSYVMRDVKKVFVPSSSLLRNGSSLSRSGTAAIALVASSMNVPVLVCCETFKLSNRVMLDGCGWNERGGEEAVRETPHKSPEDPLNGWRSHPNLNLLSLKYDVCPSEYISATITEYGILPPSSVAVLLREINADDNDFEDL